MSFVKWEKPLRVLIFGLLLSSILSGGYVSGQAQRSKSVWTTEEKISLGKEFSKFTAIHVNLKDPKIQLEASTPQDSIGKVDTLANLVNAVSDEDGKAIAGINGTFFNAYTDLQPLGTLIQNGNIEHISNTGSIFGVGAHNEVYIEGAYVAIKGGTMDQWVWPFNWYSWSINHFYANEGATMIFDASYKGTKPKHSFTVISVSAGVVIQIDKGSFNIPPNGFLIMTNDKKIIEKFSVGTQTAYDFDFYKNTYGKGAPKEILSHWDGMMTAIGAGPTLVKGCKIVVNPKGEGFTEAKILTSRGQRSFVGVTKDKELIMASVPNVNVDQLAEIALKMKCTEAINFDGGASSGTYANGKTLVPTGRKISNALVVKVLNTDPIYYQLNGKYFFVRSSPYWDSKTKAIYVPIRALDLYFNGYWTLPADLKLSGPSFTRNKETYVSLADAARLLGVEGFWNLNTQTVEFKK